MELWEIVLAVMEDVVFILFAILGFLWYIKEKCLKGWLVTSTIMCVFRIISIFNEPNLSNLIGLCLYVLNLLYAIKFIKNTNSKPKTKKLNIEK